MSHFLSWEKRFLNICTSVHFARVVVLKLTRVNSMEFSLAISAAAILVLTVHRAQLSFNHVFQDDQRKYAPYKF